MKKIITLKIAVALALILSLTVSSSTLTYAGLFSKRLPTPTNPTYYWEGTDLCVEWNKVENAGGYKVTYDGKTSTVTNNYIAIPSKDTDFKDGVMVKTINIQAVPGNNKYKESKIATEKITAEIMEPLSSYTYWLDGKVVAIDLNDFAPYGYEIDGKQYGFPNIAFTIPESQKAIGYASFDSTVIINPGPITVRQSKPVRIQGKCDLSANNIYEASFLDYESLLKFLDSRGLHYSTSMKNGNTQLIVSINSKSKTLLDSVGEELSNNATDIIISGLQQEGKLKDKANAAADEAIANAVVGAGKYLWDSFISNNNNTIKEYLVYEYSDKDRACEFMQYYYLKSTGSKPNFSNLTYDAENGYYIAGYEKYNRKLRVKCGSMEDYWWIAAIPDDYLQSFNAIPINE